MLQYGNMLKDDKYVQNRFEKYYLLISDCLNLKFANNKSVSILDVGGYTADMLYFIKQKNKISVIVKNRRALPLRSFSEGWAIPSPYKIDYTVIDADPAALEIAKKRGAKILRIDLHEKNALSKINKKFDIVICTEVLEHLLYPGDILKSLKKLVKTNSTIIISLPNENTIFHRIYSLLGVGIDALAFKSFKHLHLPTIAQSREFVKKYFRIERELYYINFSNRSSHFTFVGTLFSIVPEFVWQMLANIFPNLLARGVVFRLKK